MNIVLSFLLSVLAGIAAYYICKWLDGKYQRQQPGVARLRRKKTLDSTKSRVFAFREYVYILLSFDILIIISRSVNVKGGKNHLLHSKTLRAFSSLYVLCNSVQSLECKSCKASLAKSHCLRI